MRVGLHEHHHHDENGNPTGGQTGGVGFGISWQDGPLGRGEERKAPNGAFVEDVIAAAAGRLEFYQGGKFACQENADALHYLYMALDILDKRTADRNARAVEGTHSL